MKFRALAAGSTALALGVVGALAVAGPASAADFDIVTPDLLWEGVEDDALYISDAGAYYPDFKGTGTEIYGWATDAFDGFIGDATLIWDGADFPVTLAPVSSTIVDNGLSTLTASGIVNVDGSDITVTSTLNIQGNFARWTFAFAGDAGILSDSQLEVEGNLGSDSDSTYVPVGTRGLVSHDGLGYDPILGWDSNGANLVIDAVDGSDDLAFTFDAVSATTLTVALQDYDPCLREAALAQMTAAVPTLTSQFGASFAPLYSTDCATVVSPSLTPGPVSAELPITSSAALTEWGYFSPSGEQNLGVVATGLPAGLALTVSFVGTVPTLHLTGTLPAGSYDVSAYVYLPFEEDGTENYYPLQITFTIGTALAATGAELPTPVIIGASILTLLGAGLVLAASRRRMSVTR